MNEEKLEHKVRGYFIRSKLSFGNFVHHLCESHIVGFPNYSNPVYATTTQP